MPRPGPPDAGWGPPDAGRGPPDAGWGPPNAGWGPPKLGSSSRRGPGCSPAVGRGGSALCRAGGYGLGRGRSWGCHGPCPHQHSRGGGGAHPVGCRGWESPWGRQQRDPPGKTYSGSGWKPPPQPEGREGLSSPFVSSHFPLSSGAANRIPAGLGSVPLGWAQRGCPRPLSWGQAERCRGAEKHRGQQEGVASGSGRVSEFLLGFLRAGKCLPMLRAGGLFPLTHTRLPLWD